MYKGKFDAKERGQQAPADTLENILKEREDAINRRAARKSGRTVRTTNSQGSSLTQPAVSRTGVNSSHTQPVDSRKDRLTTEQESRHPGHETLQAPARRGPRTGGVIFYTLYFLCIFAYSIAVFFCLNWLNGWLKQYEAAQPTVKSQEVFSQLFTNPDWAQLYRLGRCL